MIGKDNEVNGDVYDINGRNKNPHGKVNKNNTDGKKTPYIPFIPKFLYNYLEICAEKNLSKWRK